MASVFQVLGSIGLLVVCTLTFAASQEAASVAATPPSDACIGCICYASTGCNKEFGCTEAGVCGPLLISWGYWADGGKHIIKGTDPGSPAAYPQCAQDTYCSAETLRGYMAKYARDCNGDGRIDCDDYARIHKRGPGACSDPSILDTKYYEEFSICSAQLLPQNS